MGCRQPGILANMTSQGWLLIEVNVDVAFKADT